MNSEKQSTKEHKLTTHLTRLKYKVLDWIYDSSAQHLPSKRTALTVPPKKGVGGGTKCKVIVH
jgi:hypothetical protein